ncbi:MAG: hypothetical protein Q8Q42_03470 [Nanoarchaeota archaeon]|nr:hypothetical protein [Nanoarchaeota archaeon]
MRGVRVRKVKDSSVSHKALNYLTVFLLVLITALLFTYSDTSTVTGYVVANHANPLGEIYGGLAPLVLILIVVVLIVTYRKIVEN